MTTLEETKLEKLLIFSNCAIFHAFFRKYIGPTVTIYVGKSSSGLNCHIVTVGPRFWGTTVPFLVGRTLLALSLDHLSLGLNEQQSSCH
jgi:hypothetical protein